VKVETGNVLLVIPCFQESKRIGAFLPGLCSVLGSVGNVSILVVEDGGGTSEQVHLREMIDEWRKQHKNLLPPLLIPTNLGKGGAIYQGWKQPGDAQWLAFVDADGSCSASEVRRLIELARSENRTECAYFASRVLMLGRNVKRLWTRHLIGRVYATLVSELLDIPVYDSQCGLKIVSRAVFEKVRDKLSIKGFAFDVDLLVNLIDSGCEVREIPIDWDERPGGKVRLIRDSAIMFCDILSIRHRRRP
jgi:dolichyl-phosphate beta-glucosyltransferase